MLTYHLHSACRFLGREDRLTTQMEVVGEKHSSLFVRVFGQVPGRQESVTQALASSWALFHISHVQDKAQIDIGILYQNLVQLIKARTGGSINTAGLISVLYFLIRHLNTVVPHCKISGYPLKNKHFHIHTPQFLSLRFSMEGKKIQDFGTTPAGSVKRRDGRRTGRKHQLCRLLDHIITSGQNQVIRRL